MRASNFVFGWHEVVNGARLVGKHLYAQLDESFHLGREQSGSILLERVPFLLVQTSETSQRTWLSCDFSFFKKLHISVANVNCLANILLFAHDILRRKVLELFLIVKSNTSFDVSSRACCVQSYVRQMQQKSCFIVFGIVT